MEHLADEAFVVEFIKEVRRKDPGIGGGKLVTSVDASSQKDARMLTVEIWRTKEVLAASVSVAVTPCSLMVGFAALVSFQRILNTLVWLARRSFAIVKEFIAVVCKPLH